MNHEPICQVYVCKPETQFYISLVILVGMSQEQRSTVEHRKFRSSYASEFSVAVDPVIQKELVIADYPNPWAPFA